MCPASSTELEAFRLANEGARLQAQGWFNQAREAYSHAAKLCQRIPDRVHEALCLNGVGATSKDLGEFSAARSSLEAALAIREEVHDRRGETITLLTLGPVYQMLGLPGKAKGVLAKALDLAEIIGDRRLKGHVCFNFGQISHAAGDFTGALWWDEQALAMANDLNDPLEQAKCFLALGQTCTQLARFDEAMKWFEKRLALAQLLHHQPLRVFTLQGQALLHWRLGQLDEARRCVEHARKILARNNLAALRPGLEAFYGSLLLEGYHDADNARRSLQFALDHALQQGHTHLVAYATLELARVSEAADRLRMLNESKELFRECGDTYGEVGVLQSLCVAESESGRNEHAVQHAQEALEKARSIGDEWGEATALYNLGVCQDAQGRLPTALELLDRSVTLFDRLRYRVTGDELRTSFFDVWTVQNVYYVYVSRLLKRSADPNLDRPRGEKAFLVTERRHARALLDQIVQQESGDSHAGDDRQPAFSLRDFQERLLDVNTLLLEYSLHEGASYLFAIQKDAFDVHTLPATIDIAEAVFEVRRLAKSGPPSEFARASLMLYEVLLGPVADLLPGKRLLIVPDAELHYLPFGMLVTSTPDVSSKPYSRGADHGEAQTDARGLLPRLTPKGAPSDWNHLPFLVAQNAMAYAPSAAVFSALDRKRRLERAVDHSLDFVGFAPFYWFKVTARGRKMAALPRTRDEVERVAKLFRPDRTVLWPGANATKSHVTSGELKQSKYIHFATHGLVNPFEPRDSALIFYGNNEGERVLTAAEIMNLELTADVVVLSACQTALGKLRFGEGLIGLARAFLYAGAQSVYASLWEVADAATAELTYCYYRNVVEYGLDNMIALQTAQVALLNSEKWSAPYYWAPFILVGG